MRYVYYVTAFLVVLTISIAGFRGRRSTQPPVEVFPDMDRQAKYKPQADSRFFADGRADRPLPAGVVPRGRTVAPDPGFLRADDLLYRGKTPGGEFARGFPPQLVIDQRFMTRGKECYTIYCSPCHGALGDGQGITKAYGMVTTASYHDDRIRQMAEGEIFNTITNGKNTMFAYADKLSPGDRWAVIAYVRALERARLGTINDVPADHKADLGP
ncbi:MAG: cytochrome c [Opitutaceae bacterium]|jgi:mono/diheme cytochrome c family protein